jgi:hypothetical protein
MALPPGHPALDDDEVMRTQRFRVRVAADPRGHALIVVPFGLLADGIKERPRS